MITSNIPNLSSMSMVRAKVDLQTASALVTCTCGDFLSDFKVTREGDNSKFFGFGICHKLDINLIDIERALDVTKGNTVEIGLGDGGEVWDAPYPTFYITEIKRDEKSNTISGTAYDRIYWAGEYLFQDLGLEAPYNLMQVAQAVAAKLGLVLNIESNIHSSFELSYEEGANVDGAEDLRTILNKLAEATQSIYYINSVNELVFKRLDRDGEAVKDITKNDYYTLTTGTPRTLTHLCNTTELGNNVETELEEDGAIQYIRNNPFLELRDDLTTILENALGLVGGTTITQFDCDWVGDYLIEIGDKLALETEDGGTVYSYLLSDTVTYAGTLSEITEWEYTDEQPETYANPTNIGDRINQTFAKVDKINKEITLMASDVTDTKSQVAQLKIDTTSIALRVEQASNDSAYAKDKLNGIESQQTALGYAFSDLQVKANEIELRVEAVESKDFDYDISEDENFVALTEKVSELELTDSEIRASVKAIEKVSQDKIDSLGTELDTLTSEVNLKVSADDLTILVNKSLEQGVDKITTSSKKYTFDDAGLDISSSDSEISTQISEDGMTIKKNNSEVLTANNQGVVAQDLQAITYLIIGENSRLEDWGNRTACFWIGG